MSVELEPGELGFRRPFSHEVTQVLRLRNINHEPVAFKVKTTAPKQYCVRPNSGKIDPGKAVEVQVLLQAMKEDPPLDARCRDKFLVQSVVIGAAVESANVNHVWSEVEKTAKETIKERKIRVNFLPATDASPHAPGGAATNGAVPDDAPPAYRSPSPAYGSPAPHGQQSATSTPSRGGPEGAGADASVLASASSSAQAAAASAGQTLQQQLDAAKATIAQLRADAEAKVDGLRQRKVGGAGEGKDGSVGSGGTGLATQASAAEGVPVQIVAALCLLSFLLAYIFF